MSADKNNRQRSVRAAGPSPEISPRHALAIGRRLGLPWPSRPLCDRLQTPRSAGVPFATPGERYAPRVPVIEVILPWRCAVPWPRPANGRIWRHRHLRRRSHRGALSGDAFAAGRREHGGDRRGHGPRGFVDFVERGRDQRPPGTGFGPRGIWKPLQRAEGRHPSCSAATHYPIGCRA